MYQNYIMLHSTLWIFRSDSSIELLDDMCTEPQDVVEVDNDLKFGIPKGGYFGSPSLLVKELSLAGK